PVFPAGITNCQSLAGKGFTGGALACNAACTDLDLSGCTVCSNGKCEPGEDATNCPQDCAHPVPPQSCGNQVIDLDKGEQCDPSATPSLPDKTDCTTISQGFSGGKLACKTDGSCQFDVSQCQKGTSVDQDAQSPLGNNPGGGCSLIPQSR